MLKDQKKARLILADGTIFNGYSFGAQGTAIGEVVFTTGEVGYQETLTDPSFYGQLVTHTFPLIGNYGVNGEDFESDGVHFKGYIVREWCEAPSNFRMTGNLDEFLKKYNVVGIYGIDTRALTRKIREAGVMNGMITTEELDLDKAMAQIRDFAIADAVKSVSVTQRQEFPVENPRYHVALFDFGYKYNIRRWLNRLGCHVTVVPPLTTAQELKEMGVDGIMLSNGPGDPAENVEIIKNLKEIAKLGIPMFGICLGHQLMALAMGATTSKMKYGHRGGNQPVIDLERGRTYITSQNHGFAVDASTIPVQIGHVSHINANDKSCEGIRYTAFPCFTVQFHPEASSGPHDTNYLFQTFMDLIAASKEDAACR